MHDVLLFRLAGLMAAWGEIAVDERRSTWSQPSKSAVLGLVAGAMGIDRADEAAHLTLHRTLGFAVRVDSEGRPLRDYHTVQSPRSGRTSAWATRAEEVSGPASALNTKLTDRYYFVGQVATIGLWQREEGGPSLAAIAQALLHPRFVPYLGRKSCPTVAPFAPDIVVGDSLEAAFAAYAPPPLPEGFAVPAGRTRLYADAGAPLAGLPDEVRERRDDAPSRRHWTFAPRTEWMIVQETPS
ncbi:type I-E CRISPR-associated protein Cas5/CasD [Magnetospirillum molischianum]|uniref:CRISPR-associated protein, Cas5e family n=1 Tax=Magnetospirillum molischianum DSM 120 TaxID=1150626 RepID=H8FVT6_MAGML|nr:type I-E CRISPR-associated protein Cas5/CasD [Magnetospirillum molischianum]CCG42474.1 CRISPR-associated protein, Cas5e family [Magnetospirillum molischianum DSM 120]